MSLPLNRIGKEDKMTTTPNRSTTLCVVLSVFFLLLSGCGKNPVKLQAVPVITSAIAGDSSVIVSWRTSAGATSYNLYFKDGATVDKSSGTMFTGVTSPTLVTGLTSGTQYVFAVSAVNADGESNLSNMMTATPKVSAITDTDGNVYHAVMIGTQVWMVENLKTTRYNDGTALPLVTDSAAWLSLVTPGYCWYKNDSAAYGSIYGALYNFFAVRTGKLAPKGWHIAKESEWDVLNIFLGTNGGPLKETGTTHWASPNIGATNSTGFSALPGGYRFFCASADIRGGDQKFNYNGYGGYWWTSTAYESDPDRFSYCYSIVSSGADIFNSIVYNQCGFSVRCILDN
jgi:uncharacterized protein (TIGR02145 family)